MNIFKKLFGRKVKLPLNPNTISGDALQGVPFKRNLKAFRIEGDDILRILSGKFKFKDCPIPADAEYLDCYYDFAFGGFFIKLRHPSFEEVPPQTLIPCYDAKEFVVVKKKGEGECKTPNP